MAFNPSDFVKNQSKPIGERIVSSAVRNATNGLPISSISSASDVASSLLNSGSSFQTIAAVSSQRASATTEGGTFLYGLAGKDPSRTSEADLSANRRSGQSSDDYFHHVNPTTKINRVRRERSGGF